MSKLTKEWNDAFQGCFTDEEDVVEFIFEHLDTSDFEKSYFDCVGFGEPNECIKITEDDKRSTLYDFMMDLIRKKDCLSYDKAIDIVKGGSYGKID